MNRRLLTIAGVALLISMVATFFAYRTLNNQQAGTPQKMSQIVLAAHNIGVGTILRSSDLTMADWAGSIAKGMVLKPEAVIGRGVAAPIYSGEPVMEARLAASGSGGGLAATIPLGMRACAVKVNEVVGVAGFVTPGMRVDVLISNGGGGAGILGIIGGGGGGGSRVKTLLQYVEVLSAGTDIQRDTQGKPSQVPVVNLLVTPEQAEILSLANNETRIQLVLRNPVDTQIVKTSGAALSRLFDDADMPPQAPAAPAAPKARSAELRPPGGRPATGIAGVFEKVSSMLAAAPSMQNAAQQSLAVQNSGMSVPGALAAAQKTAAPAPPAVEVIYGTKKLSEVGK